ncbi:hypothetical protein HERIO_294 [Hepatospora eriocheir]|uniref:Uncharacterized protein n=1 Tax=Hepatospora eriocheir TaxID=1081669 RepID=A0A1X0QDH3_9MICR|nr:hypothetical protein HERIO_294 [Hepatospora eriocheir]
MVERWLSFMIIIGSLKSQGRESNIYICLFDASRVEENINSSIKLLFYEKWRRRLARTFLLIKLTCLYFEEAKVKYTGILLIGAPYKKLTS